MRFPAVPAETWKQRLRDGKVLWKNQTPIAESDPYTPNGIIHYFREVEEEPEIPFRENILYQDENLLVADKPHFLPVNPSSVYVTQCLLYRLRKSTGIDDLTPIHRIDRWTAGLVMFSTNPGARTSYQQMFINGEVKKRYHGVARINDKYPETLPTEWLVENRIVNGNPGFRMKVEAGPVNARSHITCVAIKSGVGLFHLQPITGKTHQLRLHMSGLGYPLLNERYYPELQPKAPDDFDNPLQLLAKELEFTDPITGTQRQFCSGHKLAW